MNGDDGTALLSALLCLVLVTSALAARRLPLGETLKMALAWVLLFAAAAAAYALRDEFAALGRRIVAGGPTQQAVGRTLRIPMSEDGHFWVDARVDGVEVRFLVDSGATTTAVSQDTVELAELARVRGFPVVLSTGNGPVTAERVRIARLEVGPIERRDVAAVSARAFGDMDVLGMNFLSSLRRWGVEGRTLVLEP